MAVDGGALQHLLGVSAYHPARGDDQDALPPVCLQPAADIGHARLKLMPAFAHQRADLIVGPQVEDSLESGTAARFLICFLAYALWKTLQQWQSRAGLGDSPRTILTEFSRIHAADVVLPLVDGSARELRLRCVVRPDRAQALLLQRLGLTLPQRHP